jgi:tRNA-Thr(GGU) m(6)t(6)A37 methyltransferase TsaA
LDKIFLNPVGHVVSSIKTSREMPAGGVPAAIEILPQYESALLRIEENSHIWILSWFHQSDRSKLAMHPGVNRDLPEYGVFALRSASRPNPIAISIAKLLKREGNRLILEKLDAVDSTPVIDIKPYFENDIIFSPRTSYIPGRDREYRQKQMLRRAIAHHQEECLHLQLAVRMAMVAEEIFGHLNQPDLIVSVRGSACLADTIQGLSRARLANPPRFSFVPSMTVQQTNWDLAEKGTLTLTWLGENDIMGLADEELLNIDFEN